MLDVFEIPRFPPSARNPSGLPPSIGETIQLSNNKFSSNTFKKCEKQFCKIQILCPSINGCFRTEKSLLARISFRDSVHCLCPIRKASLFLGGREKRLGRNRPPQNGGIGGSVARSGEWRGGPCDQPKV